MRGVWGGLVADFAEGEEGGVKRNAEIAKIM